MTTPTPAIAGGVLVLGLVLSGCSTPAAQPEAEPVRYATAVIDSLVPGNHFEGYAVLSAIFAPLTAIEEDGTVTPLAAESVESEDATTWTITLRDGWTFHNGEEVTAQHYVDAWNYNAYAPNAMVNGPQLAAVVGYGDLAPAEGDPAATELAGLTVVDELTFTVELAVPDRQFPLQLTALQTGLFPMPSGAFDDLEAYQRAPIGNGPFAVVGEWDPDQPLETVAYEDYAGPEPTIDALTFVPYIDTTVAYTDALAGEVDIVGVFSNQAEQARADFGDRYFEFDAPGVDIIGINLADPRFADPRIRQALSMAIDRDAINDALFGGSQIPADSLTAPSLPGDPAGVCGEYCEFDPEAAAALLEEAGGIDGPFEILFIGGWGQEDYFEAIANQLRQHLDLEVTAAPATDFAAFQEVVLAEQANGLYRARWGALYPSQRDTLVNLYTASGAGNWGAGFYSSPEVDELLRAADAADSVEATLDGYRAVQERILEDFPVIPMFGNRYIWVTSERIASLENVSGSVLLSEVELAG